MLFNHHETPNLVYYYSDHNETQKEFQAARTSTPQIYETSRDIYSGEELFTTYGESYWFESRGMNLSTGSSISENTLTFKHTVSSLESNGVCVSYIQNKGENGVFSIKAFNEGDLVVNEKSAKLYYRINFIHKTCRQYLHLLSCQKKK